MQLLKRIKLLTILIFVLTFCSIIPIIIIQQISTKQIDKTISENIQDANISNMVHLRSSLTITLDAYNDILAQFYADDNLVENIKDIANGTNKELSLSELKKLLRNVCYSKEGIKATTVITTSGDIIFYDTITASFMTSSWLGEDKYSPQEVYDLAMNSNSVVFLSTRAVQHQRSNEIYLFHLTHKIINYRDIHSKFGVIVISLDEEIINKIINPDYKIDRYSFITNIDNVIISHPDKSLINTVAFDVNGNELNALDFSEISENVFYYKLDKQYYFMIKYGDWNIITIVDESAAILERQEDIKNFVFITFIILTITLAFIILFASLFSRTIKTVVRSMEDFDEGELPNPVETEHIYSKEMNALAESYNAMLLKTKDSIHALDIANYLKRDAEIKMLEAQINPHFIYNILDSISWMAIDYEQYELSKVITSLGKILRYSISNSNLLVTLEAELKWLERYIDLQQIRFENKIMYIVNIPESLLYTPCHKLIMQPFVENAIIHGFKNHTNNMLKINISEDADFICITIADNGHGIDEKALYHINKKGSAGSEHLGISNGIGRIISYNPKNEVHITSELNKGTIVNIKLSKDGDI